MDGLEGSPSVLRLGEWPPGIDGLGGANRPDSRIWTWLVSFRKVAQVQKQCPATMLVSVGDREADVYQLFELALSDPLGPKLLIRAEQDRLLAESQGHLWEKMAEQEVSGIQEIHVPRHKNRQARVVRSSLKKRNGKPWWLISLKIRNLPRRLPPFERPSAWLAVSVGSLAAMAMANQGPRASG